MRVFLTSGLVYLTGIAIVLLVKPSLMFRDDGSWKEFGIGRDEKRYTWMPLWLFCILWALVSYIVAILILKISGYHPVDVKVESSVNASEFLPKRKIRRGSDLPEGYYVLSKSTKSGEPPTYVYLGEQA
jgi:hypothetical protein